MRFVGNARFARSRGKTILINAQMNAKRRGSYLSENKGDALSGFLKEAVSQVRCRLLRPLTEQVKIFSPRQRLQVETSELFAKEGSGRQILPQPSLKDNSL